MTTEYVSVPRDALDDLLNTWEKEFSVLQGILDNFIAQGEAFATQMHIKELKAILSRATPISPRVVSDEDVERLATTHGKEYGVASGADPYWDFSREQLHAFVESLPAARVPDGWMKPDEISYYKNCQLVVVASGVFIAKTRSDDYCVPVYFGNEEKP